jgi:uncharacterized protein (DUF2267 family)
MSHTETGLDAIERTLQKTNEWIKQVENGLGREDRHYAFQALRSVLRHLRDRLPVAVAAHLGDQLPILIRGIYYENWSPMHTQPRIRKAEEFLDLVAGDFPKEYDFDAERMAKAIFGVLRSHLTEGEIGIIIANLPMSLRELWA